MIVQQLTGTEADVRIHELEYLAKGLENKAKSLMSDINNPDIFRRLQNERKASIARWQEIVDNAEIEFEAGAAKASQYAQRAREMRVNIIILKRRHKIEELLALGAMLHEVEAILGDSNVAMLHALSDPSVKRTIQANAEAVSP